MLILKTIKKLVNNIVLFPYKFYRLLRSARNDVVVSKNYIRHCERSKAIQKTKLCVNIF